MKLQKQEDTQAQRANYNVFDLNCAESIGDLNGFISRIGNSEYNTDLENFEFSMVNKDEYYGFEYDYTFNPYFGMVTGTKTTINNYEYYCNGLFEGQLTAQTSLLMEDNELDPLEVDEISDYSNYGYDFTDVLYHSAGNVLTCMLVPLEEYNSYYNYKKPGVPKSVNVFFTKQYYNVGDAFDPEDLKVEVEIDDYSSFYPVYSEEFELNSYYIDTDKLLLDSDGKFTTPGIYEASVIYRYGIDEYSDLDICEKVLINVVGSKENELVVINTKPNYKVGQVLDENSILVLRISRDAYGKVEPSFDTVEPYDESTNPNGYMLLNSFAETYLMPPVDTDGKFTTPGTWGIVVGTNDGLFGETVINVLEAEPEFVGFTAYGNKTGNYVVGDEFSLSDVIAVAFDKELKPINIDINDCTVNSNAPMNYGKFTAAGTFTCMVRYEDQYAQFEFTVDPEPTTPKLINLYIQGQNLNFVQSGTFEIGDINVTGYYTDGTSAKIDAYDEQSNPTGYIVDSSAVDMNNVGFYPVSVKAGDITVTYYVFVNYQPE